MIPSPFGWSTQLLARGGAFAHPRGPQVASILYRDRARPLRRLGALVREVLASIPAFEVTHLGEPQRLLTREGEHAALVTVRGTQAGASVQRDLGYVFGDDFYAAISAVCHEAALFDKLTELVGNLVREDTHVLGVRRRRFEYAPPPSWQPIARSGFAVEWLAPDYPRDTSTLLVYAANPRALVTQSIASIVNVLPGLGYHVEQQQPPHPITAGTLTGESVVVMATRDSAAPMLREVVVLRDDRYLYALELTSYTAERWIEARGVLRAVLDSVRPVPNAGQHVMPSAALSHWSE